MDVERERVDEGNTKGARGREVEMIDETELKPLPELPRGRTLV
jgi:hypothetical protein